MKSEDNALLKDAVDCAKLFLDEDSREKKSRFSWQLVRAIVLLTEEKLKDPEESSGHYEFTVEDIWEKLLKLDGKPVPKGDVETAKWIKARFDHLSKGNTNFENIIVRLEEIADENNLSAIFRVKNILGGGGKKALYYLEPAKVNPAECKEQSTSRELQASDGTIRYKTKESKLPFYSNWLGKIELTGIMKWFWAVIIILPFIVLELFIAQSYSIQLLPRKIMVFAPAFLIVYFFVFYPIFLVINRKVVIVPTLWAWFPAAAYVLKLRTINDDEGQFIHRRYEIALHTAECTKCDGKVTLHSGGLRYWGRVIGRCDECPMEHVYTFDYKTLRGYPLH
jgi:hypothetical protein